MGQGRLGVSKTFLVVWDIKALLIKILTHYLPFHCVDIWTDGAKTMTGEAAVTLAYIKAASPDCASSH